MSCFFKFIWFKFIIWNYDFSCYFFYFLYYIIVLCTIL